MNFRVAQRRTRGRPAYLNSRPGDRGRNRKHGCGVDQHRKPVRVGKVARIGGIYVEEGVLVNSESAVRAALQCMSESGRVEVAPLPVKGRLRYFYVAYLSTQTVVKSRSDGSSQVVVDSSGKVVRPIGGVRSIYLK